MTTGLLSMALVLIISGPVRGDTLDGAAVNAPPQRYIITLPQAPVAQIAEEVLGETLGLPVRTDERIGAEMGFRIDGTYSPKQLAREFGYRLWNVDVALVEDRNHGLMLIPAGALPEAVAAGGRVVAPLALDTPAGAQATASATRAAPIVYGDKRLPTGPILLAAGLALGWLGGLATPPTAAWLRRRRSGRVTARLLLPSPAETGSASFDRRRAADAEFLKGFETF